MDEEERDFRQTTRLGPSEAPELSGRPTEPLDIKWGPPWVIQLRVVNHPISIQLDVSGSIIVGRSDPEGDFYPDVDLTPYGGLEGGVSRRHAEIHASGDRLTLIDLGGVNGTRLNGYQLRPRQPYRLRHGDSLEFGSVRVEVVFTMVPVHTEVKAENTRAIKTAELRDPFTDPRTGRARVPHVLVVEDDSELASIFRTILEQNGYQVTEVYTTGAAMRLVSTSVPDLILLDVMMPDLSGLEVCRLLRRDLRTADVPIVIVSARTSPEAVREGMRAGADVYLGKPVGYDELLRAVRVLIGDPAKRGLSGKSAPAEAGPPPGG